MNNKKIHIGEIVEKAFNQSGKSKKEFAVAIGIHNQNVNREFKNPDWSAIKLIDAGKFLEHDFGYLFSLGSTPPKMILQIEVTKEKITNVLKAIENQELFEVFSK